MWGAVSIFFVPRLCSELYYTGLSLLGFHTTRGTFSVDHMAHAQNILHSSVQTMPVRRRHDPCARDGAPCWRVNASLVALTALAVARHWVGVESFVAGTGAGGVIDPPAARSSKARAPVRPRRSTGRCRHGVLGRVRGMGSGLALRASLDDDEDEFDAVSSLL